MQSDSVEVRDTLRDRIRRRKGSLALLLAFCVVGAALVRDARANPAIEWMYIYHAWDFQTIPELIHFLANLRVPIPPVIATAEILSQQLFGSTDVVTVVAYRAALVLSYVMALVLAIGSRRRFAVSLLLSTVFLWGSVIVHARIPMVYDALWPLFVLTHLLTLKLAAENAPRAILLCAASGFCLSMAELSRPFMIALLPVFLFCAWQALRHQPRRSFAALLAPLLLFSGGWHAFTLLRHGQIALTNHGGFNVARAWPMVETPALEKEPGARPLRPGRWKNLDTEEHARNSQRLLWSVAEYVVTHPLDAAYHALRRVEKQTAGVTSIYGHRPEHAILGAYRLSVFAASRYLLVMFVLLGIYLFRARQRAPTLLARVDNTLILVTTLTIVCFAVGERGEEARMTVAFLPLLAALPIARGLTDDAKAGGRPWGSMRA